MNKTYFIADLHLNTAQPHLTALFSQFMHKEAIQGEALYILGDLFDFWIGDDDRSELSLLVQTEIKRLTDQGIAVYFQRGNRDFLIGKQFADKCGLQLLADYHIINLYGTPTLLCHGDTLCIDDHSYQQYRKKVHQSWRQRLFLCLPLFIRLKIANNIRTKSRQQKCEKSLHIMDVNPHFVTQIMQKFHVSHLIHGHTHRQAIHQFNDEQNHSLTRIVLGDWRDSAPYLVYTKNKFEFKEYKIENKN